MGPQTVNEFPGGKEADPIIGDFLMRNDLVEAVISCDAPMRKANMGTFWGAPSPGCLYDLTHRGENNDQLTVFAPSDQEGEVTYVRLVKDGSDGEAAIETFVSGPSNGGVEKSHLYRLRDGMKGLLITTTFNNLTSATKEVVTKDSIPRLRALHSVGKVQVADSNDPASRVGYACGWVEEEGSTIPTETVVLNPGERIQVTRFFAIGISPAEAYGEVAKRQGKTGILFTEINDDKGENVLTTEVEIEGEQGSLTAYTNEVGEFRVNLLPGDYRLTLHDHGRKRMIKEVTIHEGKDTVIVADMGPVSMVKFDITGDDGKSLPCKAQFIGIEGTESPNLGPKDRARGCLDQYHSHIGEFSVPLNPGKYRIVVTHGIEFSHLAKDIELATGETEIIAGTLSRIVDTTGMISADFHNHSTPSGDNVCGTDDRIMNIAAEQVEFTPTTEHNRFYDWEPHIARLGLAEEIKTISGVELTGRGAHLNSFPFEPVPFTQDGGCPIWDKDPRISAITLRNWQGRNPDRWVQINHPDMTEDFLDWNMDGVLDWGYQGLASLIDGCEVWWEDILSPGPVRIEKLVGDKEVVRYKRQFIWLQLLNYGHRYTAIAVSDAHAVHGNGVGGWRTYIPSSTDKPSEIDWKEILRNAKAGQVTISNGPYLEVSTADGTLPGGTVRAVGSIPLHVKVQCTDWIDIDRVQILVNSRQVEDLNFTRESHPEWFGNGVVKFDRNIEVPLGSDSHLIVVAWGENHDLSVGYGSSWQSRMHPCAYTNPIYVDYDGGGFEPNGDSLGYPLPTGRITVDQAKAIIGKHQEGEL
ncbi:MAG: CehA/McbA family metallohydrolase [Candidatus Omnitrophica bacterium]|nr:CehA/McbA family metallohydrolase [Candidatus Omnitrophota bacterium]